MGEEEGGRERSEGRKLKGASPSLPPRTSPSPSSSASFLALRLSKQALRTSKGADIAITYADGDRTDVLVYRFTPEVEKRCERCHKIITEKLQSKCPCRCVRYCSRNCQCIHWKWMHRYHCALAPTQPISSPPFPPLLPLSFANSRRGGE